MVFSYAHGSTISETAVIMIILIRADRHVVIGIGNKLMGNYTSVAVATKRVVLQIGVVG